MSVQQVTATEAARGFSALLDAVEHAGESFVVTRNGRSIARIEPTSGARGADVKSLLARHRPDRSWSDELHALRATAAVPASTWPD